MTARKTTEAKPTGAAAGQANPKTEQVTDEANTQPETKTTVDTADPKVDGDKTSEEVTDRAPEGDKPKRGSKPKERVERYEAAKPGGGTVTVEHNLDTGVTKVV